MANKRKLKQSKMDVEISEAASPVSTNITHAILPLTRKSISRPLKGQFGPCAKGPGTGT